MLGLIKGDETWENMGIPLIIVNYNRRNKQVVETEEIQSNKVQTLKCF